MKTRILGMAIGLGALWSMSPGCSQPAPECTVGTATAYPFATKLYLQSGDATCNPSFEAYQSEEMGMQVYNPDDGSGQVDTERRLVAIQTVTAGNYERNGEGLVEGSVAYSLGEFEGANPNEQNFCVAPTLSTARVTLPLIPGEEGGGGAGGGPPPPPIQDEVDIEIAWSDLQVYVTTANLGNQAQGTMTYTDHLKECSATYKVVMLWPTVHCEEMAYFAQTDPPDPEVPDDEGTPCDPIGDPASCVPCDPEQNPLCEAYPTGRPNNALCDQEPDPQGPYFLNTGSGIASDLTVVCDPLSLLCIQDTDSVQTPQND
ncbi:hypothetical protein [Chondromyces apiculatus]|uniref:Epstein-Barr nuclear antigen 1 n=1 Tax=Chondromyces apiculatus DSM 436 TaxID=1192034 RepID=A0A017T381_9BACT|nr:hypothetical protein [Chondromyces apiculatus]EYF03704.1 Epstein-Barr nuclear antigen 1 [Chondromyces apiculatus DSM 436]